MGLFGSDVICDVCGNKVNKKRNKLSDGAMCDDCFRTVISSMNFDELTTALSVGDAKEIIFKVKESAKYELEFSPTFSVGDYFFIDEDKKLWGFLPSFQGKNAKAQISIYRYDELESYELIKNGESVISGGLGSAVIGGALFGGAGAITGGAVGKKNVRSKVNMYKIKIKLSDSYKPIYIDLLRTLRHRNMLEESTIYKQTYNQAQTIISVLDKIIQIKTKKEERTSETIADEIIKLKDLLDGGIITEEEFKMAKLKLLS